MKADRTSPIPPAAIEHVEWASEHLGLTSRSGERVTIEVRNTIEMQHVRTAEGKDTRIILDWSHLERVLVFGHFFWSLQGARLWKQKVSGFLEQEIFLAASRSALLDGHHAVARNLHNAYVNFEFGDLIPHGYDIAAQSREFSWYVAFAAFRELARPDATGNLSEIHQWLSRISPDISDDQRPDDASVVEVYLDHVGVNEILSRDPRTVEQSLIGELLLYVAIDQLVRVARFVGPHVERLIWLDEAIAHSRTFAHDLRFSILRAHAEYCASRIEDPDAADRMRSEMEMAMEFHTLLTRGMNYGLGRLKLCNPFHRKSLLLETSLQAEFPDEDQKRDIQDMIMAFVDPVATADANQGIENA